MKSINRWYTGIPPLHIVREHETNHGIRSDGVVMRTINVCSKKVEGGERIDGNEQEYGTWLCDHVASPIQRYTGIVRLKVIDGRVLQALGFTSWMPLDEMIGAEKNKFYPVGEDGLPVDYAAREY